ncbi:MAG: hypothetical protein JF606_29445 [Burkholderiales bacterium]|nr:hypothetical protein [Burkholderiales bacterium]
MVKNNPPQQFQPLSRLPLVRSISEGHLGDLRTLRRKLAGTRTQPHVFDDATIDRVVLVHTETLGFLPYTRCSYFVGAAELLADATKPAPADELKALLRNFQQMSIVAETEINKAIQSCKRARGQHLEAMAAMPMRKQVFH